MTRLRAILALLSLGTAAACTEQLAAPTTCPELCPGVGLIVRDTVLLANEGQDSSYTGYVGAQEMSALLLSDGIAAGEARAFATFPRRSDSVLVAGAQQPITLDSVAFSVQLVARDTAVKGLTLFLHRITPDLDSTATLAALDAELTPGTLIDSVLVSDTLKTGSIRLVLGADKLNRLVGAESDSGRLGVGYRLKAAEATGIRIGSLLSSAGGPLLTGYGRVAVADTALQKQSLTLPAEKANYLIEPPPAGGTDRLVVGGKLGTRSILRFTLPRALRDSASILRATLELTPAGPVPGLRNDPAALQVRGVLVDLGAKSPVLATLNAAVPIPANATEVQLVEVIQIVSAWLGAGNSAPTVLLMGIAPEGASFGRPVFFSSLAAAGKPRLRITYALPSRPGHP